MRNLLKNTWKAAAGFLAIALICVIALNGAYAAPNQVTIKAADYTKDFINDNDSAMTMFTTTDGNTVYCMDIDKKALVSGMSATLTGDADASVLYILQNGYPKKTYRNNKGMDAYITQMALWMYLSEDKVSNNFKNATGEADKYGLVAATKNLVSQARKAKDTGIKPSMSVNAGAKEMTLTSDGKYYESAYMSATLTGAKTYNVSVSGASKNTIVVDEGGNLGTTMNSGEKFKVKVPVSEASNMNITVNFTATGAVTKAKIYTPSDSSYQRVVGVYEDTTDLSGNATLTLTPKRVCEYTDGKDYGKDGNEVDEKTYIKECKHVCEFTDNKYYGKNGTEVDKKTFNKECNASCEYVDGEYHGKDGSVVDKATFDKECKKVCEYTDGKYYGKDGNEVDKDTYNKECNKTCAIIDGKYYGKDGKAVDKKTFEKQCKNSCQYIDGKYYGLNGSEVDASTYQKECGNEVIVPNTKADISSLGLTLGAIMMLSGTSLIVFRKKMLF